ncbi:integrin alpha-3 isoform X2 [Ambystoma mexicanum]|uniref:integrin alpha-3 isoform X2 n=1 Tax=Ambystoma mexicanum TaxID=8296 RepID=UPI0037E8408B
MSSRSRRSPGSPSALLLLLPLLSGCCASNLDWRFPVVKEGPTPGSFFGFSVALHQQTVGKSRYLLLTGAPQEVAPPDTVANRTGALYYCPITTATDDCQRVDLDEKIDPQESFIENMWLGVTIASQNPAGRVLVCAHRYTKLIKSDEPRRMIGKCYVRGNDLTFDTNDEWQTDYYELCNQNTYYELTGMCQLGMSGGFSKDMVYFGAPGAYHWQGKTYVVQRAETSDLGKEDYYYPNKEQHNYYTGYAVQMGSAVLHKVDSTVLAGAPRWEHKGAVNLMSFSSGKELQSSLVLVGKQVGSYFGSALALADLNNDGWQDLLVGAPFYFERKEEIGGAVYVYINEAGSFQNVATPFLVGPSGSGFGFAVANIGDINQDGFQDIAVGAPFEDSGKVYIYHSSSEGLMKTPSQVIDGKDVGPKGIPTFGYSLNGGLDVDDNAYPDLLVGSLADRIALLRSRPVINISKTFTVTPSVIDPNKCTSTSCIEIELCFSYLLSTGNANYRKNITLTYTLEADKDRRPARVRFPESNSAVYRGFFNMPETQCQKQTLLLMDNIRDKLHPIKLSLNYSIYEKEIKARQMVRSLDNFPVLNEYQNTTDQTEINFQKECGMDNTCISNLQVTYRYVNEKMEPLERVNGVQVLQYQPNSKIQLNMMVTNLQTTATNGEDAHEALLNITVPPMLLFSSVRPSGSCVYDGTVLCELGNPFKRNQKAELTVTFETSLFSLKTKEVVTQLQLSTLSKQSDLSPVSAKLLVEYTVQTLFTVNPVYVQTYFSGTVMGESAMKKVTDVGSPVELHFLVKTVGDFLEEGTALVAAFEWPFEIANGKWLLYLTEVLVNGSVIEHCTPPGDVVNPLNLTVLGQSPTRGKRELEHEEETGFIDVPLAPSSKAAKAEYLLSCNIGTANCIRFECPLRMTNAATITVRGRVWNSTFLEEYNHLDRVKVEGAAMLYLKSNITTIRMQNYTRTFYVNIDSELVEEVPVQLELWVIIVSALAGVFLLTLIVLLLWKCGFFRRANTRAMYEAKGQKAEMKSQPSETERLTEDY